MKDILQQEQAALDRFIDLLNQEQAALVNADVDALLALTETKLKQTDQLTALAGQRVAMLARAGFAADAAGVSGWLASQPKAVADAWHQLLDSAQAAQRINQTNGKLIQTHLQHNQQALSTLLNASNRANVYGPDGQARTGAAPGQRSIGKV